MALTKNDIVAKVNDLGFTKKKSIETVESLLEIIKGTLEDGDDVLVSGFGKFCVKEKKKRRGRNPATGSDLTLRERKVVTFKCSGKLRSRINVLSLSCMGLPVFSQDTLLCASAQEMCRCIRQLCFGCCTC